jgi:hypothetical protein
MKNGSRYHNYACFKKVKLVRFVIPSNIRITVLLLGFRVGRHLITVLFLGRGMLVLGLGLENLFRAYTGLASARDVLL